MAEPAFKEMKEYSNKLLEFAHANSSAAFYFAQRACRVKSPSEFMELSTEHARSQTQKLTEQAKELAEIAKKVALAAAKPMQEGVAKSFDHAA
jgi:phasin family protein